MTLNSRVFNDLGRAAFLADTNSGGTRSIRQSGIWSESTRGLSMVARSGEALRVAPGDRRILAGLTFIGGTGNQDGRPSALTETSNLLIFRADFADGSSGVFISSAHTCCQAIGQPTVVFRVRVQILIMGLIGLVVQLWRRCSAADGVAPQETLEA